MIAVSGATQTAVQLEHTQLPDLPGDSAPIIRAAQSPREISNSRIFHEHPQAPAIDASSTAPLLIVVNPEPIEIVNAEGVDGDPNSFENDVCAADVIATGTVVSEQTMLTPMATFLFTDYGFKTDSVQKGGQGPVAPGLNITITRLGGSGHLPNGRPVIAIRRDALPLHAGRRYLLLLRKVPSGDYTPLPGYSAYEFDGDRLAALNASDISNSSGRELHSDQTLASVGSLLAGYCANRPKG